MGMGWGGVGLVREKLNGVGYAGFLEGLVVRSCEWGF